MNYKPINWNHTWKFDLSSEYELPMTWAMSTLNWTEFNTTRVYSQSEARVSAYFDPTIDPNFFAVTPCVVYGNKDTSGQRCYKYDLKVNRELARTHPDKEALLCHEIGHTVALAHDFGPTYANKNYLPVEKSCMRGDPDVHQYGVRHVDLINALW